MRAQSLEDKPLDILKLISNGLISFTHPENCKFVVKKKLSDGSQVTGFLYDNKYLVGWGLKVKPSGIRSEESIIEGLWGCR